MTQFNLNGSKNKSASRSILLRRVRAGGSVLIALNVVQIVAESIGNFSGLWHIYSLLIALSSLIIIRLGIDLFQIFVLSSVYWTFIFAVYTYSFFNGQFSYFNIFDPTRSIQIAFASHIACFLIFLFTTSAFRAAQTKTEEDLRGSERLTYFAIGFFGLVAEQIGLLPSAYAATITTFAFIFIYTSATSDRISSLQLLLSGVLAVIIIATALLSSVRTDLFTLFLIGGLIYLQSARKVVSWRKALVIIVLLQVMSVFSQSAIAVRYLLKSGYSISEAYSEVLRVPDLFVAILVPGSETNLDRLTEDFYGANPYSPPFFDDSTSFIARLTVLPQMDFVVGQSLETKTLDWDEFINIFTSVLPSIGQEKNLIFSDEVVWELGLRPAGNVGRPMITAEGELYIIGGYSLVFLFKFFSFLSFMFFYLVAVRYVPSKSACLIAFLILAIHCTFTSTAISLLANTTRNSVLLVGMLLLAHRIRLQTSRRKAFMSASP